MGDQLRNYYKSSGERVNQSLNEIVSGEKIVEIFKKVKLGGVGCVWVKGKG